ncbi:mesenteric estrogen-dependent adipogenesis protein-like [Solea solea]|uniref:mesenteric estrogen-dependent adipogenesis protein-like n=1 Tax=Solea solea TaxID=90069 RepID=UPI00272B50F4|nr:mesenteric estrogen-dependent adipogenesis protein-like [Solea solea]
MKQQQQQQQQQNNMTSDKVSHSRRVEVTELEQFLTEPPAGFSVEPLSGAGYRVHSDPERNLVLIDDCQSCRGTVVFHKSPGRSVKMQNLWEYTSTRKSLLSKWIYVLTSACDKKSTDEFTVLKQYVVAIDGSDPLIKWQMERGLDWTISSVAGESYRVDIDLTEAVESWAAKNINVNTDDLMQVEPVWRDVSFTLKYYSDALFDFPHWFGFSKRTFKLRLT